jgi:L-fuconolactonase
VQSYGAYEYDNSYAADCARQYPDRFTAVCIVDHRQADASEQLTYWVRERGVRGLRLFTTIEPEPMLEDPPMLRLWARATALAIPICVMTRFRQIARIPALLEQFPGIPVALDHLALPRLSDGPPYDALKPLFDLARFPNLYLKFSTETLYAARRGRSTPKEFFSRLLDHFGAGRVMWGSNFPATTIAA